MKKQAIFLLIFLAGFVPVQFLAANNFQGEQDVNITSVVNDDSYLVGETVLINAKINGDLVCAGGEVIIQDTITEDVLLAGGNLKVIGYIGDDLRAAGGTILIIDRVEGDLIIAGGEVTVGKDAIINGEIHMIGGKLTMNGTAVDNVNVRGGEVIWNGVAENDLVVKAGEFKLNGVVRGKSKLAARSIEVGAEAKLYSDVEYWNVKGEADFEEALLGGAYSVYNADLEVYESDLNWRYLGLGILAFWLYRFLVAVLIMALLIWMFHRFFTRNGMEANQNFARHLGIGLVYVLGIPMLIGLTFLTVVGIPIGFIIMFFYGMTLAFGHILASLLMAYGWNFYYEKNWNRHKLFGSSIFAYLSLKLATAIPFLGLFISMLVVMTAFGSMLLVWWKNRPMRSITV